MKRIPAVLALALTAAGCTHALVDHSPTQTYRPLGATAPWTITGRVERNYEDQVVVQKFAHTLVVEINGTEALRGPLDFNMAGEVRGQYQGAPVESVCTSSRPRPNYIDVQCMVLVNNERAVTLRF